MILNKYKNQIRLYLEQIGHNPLDYTHYESEGAFGLRYKDSDLVFEVNEGGFPPTRNCFYCEFTHFTSVPFKERYPEIPNGAFFEALENPTHHSTSKYSTEIQDILYKLSDWISSHVLLYREELNTDNNWILDIEPINELTSSIKIGFENEDLFTEVEKNKVIIALDTLSNSAQNELSLLPSQMAVLQKEIGEVKKQLNNQTKASWLRFAIGSIISSINLMGLSIDGGKILVALFKIAMKGISLLN